MEDIVFSSDVFHAQAILAVKDTYTVTHRPPGAGQSEPRTDWRIPSSRAAAVCSPRHTKGHDWLGATLQARTEGMSLRECGSLTLKILV